MVLKDFNLIILRNNIQERARQKNQYVELYDIEKMYSISIRTDKSKETEETLDNTLEKYIITLDVNTPVIQNLYDAIVQACPDLTNKKEYYLYWRYSLTKLLPVNNYMTYFTMLQLMANKNNNLYLITKNWNTNWLENPSARYTALPEDIDIVNMIAPKQSVFTVYQEEQLTDAKKAGITEYSRSYSSGKTEGEKSSKKSSKGSSKKKKK